MIRLLLALGLMTTAQAEARPFKASVQVDSKRLITIEGGISDLDANITKLGRLMKEGNRPVYIDINSPGGSIIAMFLFISKMEEAKGLGVAFICVVRGMAASAAFAILNECDVRYAFSSSLLMFHPGSGFLRQQIGAEEMERFFIQLSTLDFHIVKRLRKNLKMSTAIFEKHYRAETYHTPESLNALSPKYVRILRSLTYSGGK